MGRLYASAADVRTYVGDDSLEVTPAALRSASLLVARATRFARYTVGGDGKATDANLEAALRDATCEVVKHRDELGVSSDVSLAALGLQSASIGSASYTVASGSGSAYRVLPFDAYLILEAAGLLSVTPYVVG